MMPATRGAWWDSAQRSDVDLSGSYFAGHPHNPHAFVRAQTTAGKPRCHAQQERGRAVTSVGPRQFRSEVVTRGRGVPASVSQPVTLWRPSASSAMSHDAGPVLRTSDAAHGEAHPGAARRSGVFRLSGRHGHRTGSASVKREEGGSRIARAPCDPDIPIAIAVYAVNRVMIAVTAPVKAE